MTAVPSYLWVRWIHNSPTYPVILISELDEHRLETRKVEIFSDGRKGFADDKEEVGGTRLGIVADPPLAEIDDDPQFEPREITAVEFEAEWRNRRLSADRGA